jgi:U4/U6.U5 tri-snRNP-associated protein 2
MLAANAAPAVFDARAAAVAALQAEIDAEEEEERATSAEDASRLAAERRERANRASRDCPYLDTVNRALLDFDFEKCCSVSLSPNNVYACLVCGKYFAGRGPNTHAYTHSLEATHHVFMNLHTGKVYCLPDAYEIVDRSLDDIRHVLDPTFTPAQIEETETKKMWSRGLDGTDYLTGAIGLNNLKATDYVNVVLQALMRVKPVRNFFLRSARGGDESGGGGGGAAAAAETRVRSIHWSPYDPVRVVDADP